MKLNKADASRIRKSPDFLHNLPASQPKRAKRGRGMTICLAAICNIGPDRPPLIVGASDRMITFRDIEYEPEQTKLIWLATHTALLIAGEMPLHAEIGPRVLDRMKSKIPGILVKEIADIYAEEFFAFQHRYAEDTILRPLGLTHETFISKQRSMSRDFVLTTSKELQKLVIAAEAIIAGTDQAGAHIYKITGKDGAINCNIESFAAIGLGEWHAESQFMIAGFEKRWSLAQTLMLAYSAKRQAESSAGVGHSTDLFFVGPGGGRPLVASDMAQLEKEYNKQRAKVKNAEKESYKQIQKYIDGLAKADQERLKNQQPNKASDDSAGS